jgi:asparagine N-glycosylation enzyme membrane subunit Stt3
MPIKFDSDELNSEVSELIKKEAYKAYRMAMSGWLVLSLALITSGVLFFIDPHRAESSPINHNLNGLFDEGWNALWVIAGISIMYGILRPKRIVEQIGHIILSSSMIPYIVALFIERSWSAASGLFLGLGVLAASIARFNYLEHYAVHFIQREDSGWHIH